jgi:hypothetical protein
VVDNAAAVKEVESNNLEVQVGLVHMMKRGEGTRPTNSAM